ncbi:MAG: metallophosphoesterase family protein [Dethiobacteria bacterium]|jgi:putative phosphoesterase|nr:metallophosphoesterase family protein [Bacillota bacterium]
MKVGVLSDTHIPTRARALPSRIYEIFADVDMILHAGDIADESVLEELKTLAPIEAVAGNTDSYQLK